MDLGNKPKGNFKDALTPREGKMFSWLFSQLSKSSVSFEEVEKVEAFVKRVKDEMVGRLAGDIDDYVGLYLLNRFVKLEDEYANLPHVETGSLFGGSAILTLRGLRDAGIGAKVICIDPLDGYYVHQNLGQQTDSISNAPVNRESLNQNLKAFGFDENDYTVLQHLSTDPEVASFLSDKKIRSAYIDGDHSYDGVSKDWELLSPLVVEGGFIVIDNVFDLAWPDVSKFIYDKVFQDRTWKFDAIYGRSLVLTRNKGLNNSQGLGRSHFHYQYKLYQKYRSTRSSLEEARQDLKRMKELYEPATPSKLEE